MRLGISRVIHATYDRPIPYETMFRTRFQKLLAHVTLEKIPSYLEFII